ncbi:hypothetical protein ACHAW5_002703 [Stephanodiscus triporus]|uniref:homoserine dehydrogenase n=1 Tax=Stephanodiscus triporus TaxID=2934178 RepID=A0ABD3MKU6_9STRA
MEELRIAFLGFGSANRALVRMLLEKSEPSPPPEDDPDRCARRVLRIPIAAGPSAGGDGAAAAARTVPWRIVCIVTRRHGRACVPLDDGATDAGGRCEVDAEAALRRVESGRILDGSVVVVDYRHRRRGGAIGVGVDAADREGAIVVADDARTTDADDDETLRLIDLLGRRRPNAIPGRPTIANIVVEAIPSDPRRDGEPASSFIARALMSGMHVCSANKGPLAHRRDDGEETYWKLQRLARECNATYQHESSVMDGVPVFSLWKYALPRARLLSIRGCLNGTTTMILSRMEGDREGGSGDGEQFHEALLAARRMGIVETDESLDIDGYDAAAKLRALLVVLSGPRGPTCDATTRTIVPTMDEIPRDSIRDVTREDIRRAYADGRRKYRLVASARLVDVPSSIRPRWEASVRLKLLPPSDPLYNLTGTDSSVQFCTDVLGPVTVVSSNPTLVDTAYGLFSDIVRVASESSN